MESLWVLLLIFQTGDGIKTETIEFASRDLCVGAKAHLVENIKIRYQAGPYGTVDGFCVQTRRNTP